MNATALIFDIARFSYHDGPGLRTVVFLKGCPLRCAWCQNPESQSALPELMVYRDKCIRCGRCVTACLHQCHVPSAGGTLLFRRSTCTACGCCAAACPAEALRLAGRSLSVDEVMAELRRDREFFDLSGGGVTLSGGEPLRQAAWCRALLERCKAEGIGTAVETAGHLPWRNLALALPVTDYLMYDLKVLDPALHLGACGATNHRVLENLRRLAEAETSVTIRIPVVPGFNDTPAFLGQVTQLVAGWYKPPRVELLPFNRLGKAKYAALERKYEVEDLPALPPERLTALRQTLEALLDLADSERRDAGAFDADSELT